MSEKTDPRPCSDCDNSVDRRRFLTTTAGLALAGTTTAMLVRGSMVHAAPTPKSAAETVVGELYTTLTADQKKAVALAWDDPRRTRVNANWHVVSQTIGDFFNKSQQDLIRQVVKDITSEDGYERLMKQMEDDYGGFPEYSIAIFGDPAKGPFEFELTGRHLTLRADGNSVPGAAFGGPLVYGHGEQGNLKDNLFSHLTVRANEVFKALDSDQRTQALLSDAPGETAVQLRKNVDKIPGIAGSDLSKDQQKLVKAVLKDMLSTYREEDVSEAMEILKAGGGIESTRFAFYSGEDIDNDKVWDVWRIESPTVVCHFRGAPHVHAYINIQRRSS